MYTDILINLESSPTAALQPAGYVSDTNRFGGNSIQSAIDDGRLLHGDVPCDPKLERCEGM